MRLKNRICIDICLKQKSCLLNMVNFQWVLSKTITMKGDKYTYEL